MAPADDNDYFPRVSTQPKLANAKDSRRRSGIFGKEDHNRLLPVSPKVTHSLGSQLGRSSMPTSQIIARNRFA